MTPQQIETAARDFCRRIGVDPDSTDHNQEPLMEATARGDAEYTMTKLWQNYVGRVQMEFERQAMEGAVRVATEDDPLPLPASVLFRSLAAKEALGTASPDEILQLEQLDRARALSHLE